MLQSDGYNPELFVLMMGTVRPGDTLFASLLFFQPLTFVNGHYTLELPTQIHPSCLPQNTPLQQIVSFQCSINTGTPETVKFYCSSHPIHITQQQASRVEFVANR